MLKIVVPKDEFWDAKNEVFVYSDSFVLELEHSLFSLSKWESFFEIPFLGEAPKTAEQLLHYIKDMTVTPDVPAEVYARLSQQNIDEINAYIAASMTATTFPPQGGPSSSARETHTAETIYYLMIKLGIPVEFEHWHLNRLLTLINVFNRKDAPPKKMPRAEALRRQRELNAARKAKFNTSG